MNQFVFEARQRTLFGVMMLIGVISLVITYIGDDPHHTRFWSNLLHNSVFFTGVGLLALFMLAAKITAWSGWHTLFKRVWEAFSLFLIIGIVLMTIIGIAAGTPSVGVGVGGSIVILGAAFIVRSLVVRPDSPPAHDAPPSPPAPPAPPIA